MYLIFWEKGICNVAEEYSEEDETGGNQGGEMILKGTEKEKSRNQAMGEDKDGEICGGVMRGKEVENDSLSLQTTPCWQ